MKRRRFSIEILTGKILNDSYESNNTDSINNINHHLSVQVNILENTSDWGEGCCNMSGGKFWHKKVKKFEFLPQKVQIFCNLFPKRVHLDNFQLLKLKIRGKLLHNFFSHQENDIFFAEYPPMSAWSHNLLEYNFILQYLDKLHIKVLIFGDSSWLANICPTFRQRLKSGVKENSW